MNDDRVGTTASEQSPSIENLRRAQRGDRAFAGLLAASIMATSTWVVHRALDDWRGALTTGVLLAITVYLLLTRRLRADVRALAQPIPEWWSTLFDDALPYFRLLDAPQRSRFLRRVQLFVADQRVTGVQCEVTDQDVAMLAGAATMITDGLSEFRWPNHREFLVYPSAFDSGYQHDDEGERVGELLDAGPVIFSLPELRVSFTDEDWTNVAIHELAHYFDTLRSTEPGEFESEFDGELQSLLEDPQLRSAIVDDRSPIDDYALEDRQEFFAVCSEVFFEDPLLLRELHPRVYQWLVGVYQCDLAALADL